MENGVENCLGYALRFWEKNNEYKIYYNSDHAVNSKTEIGSNFLPADDFGYVYFSSAFKGLLSDYEEMLLKKYFGVGSIEIKYPSLRGEK